MAIIIKKMKPSSNVDQPKVDPTGNAVAADTVTNDNVDAVNTDSASTVAPAQLAIDIGDAFPPDVPTAPKDKLPGILDPDDNEPDEAAIGDAELTEDSAAERFVRRYGRTFRYDHETGFWYYWTGSRWKRTKTGRSFHKARLLLRELRQGSSRMASKRAVEGVEGMVARDPRIAVTSEIWDANPHQLGTPIGTINLKTGELLKADPGDYISRQTSVAPADPSASCPVFMNFLHHATGADKGAQRLLQQYAGYCLTGLTDEHRLLFVYGLGGNGKSVMQTAIKEVLGDYAITAAMETFAASKQQRHLTELAMLQGARFVGVSETENGQKWAEARINQLTGSDPVTANFMRKDHFTFIPQFKLMIVGNHKPNLSTVNDAARRRFIIVPFMHKPDKPDLKLPEKLRAEYPAILRWMIDGCLDWQQHGLVIPDVVKATTADYFEEQDFPGRWIAEKCDTGPDLKAPLSELYESYVAFAEANGEPCGTSKAFSQMLSQRGFKKTKISVSYFVGIAPKGIEKLKYSFDL
jgi:putative DNA primase/helicase